MKALLVLHGAEATLKGGPSIRVPRLRSGLQQAGWEAEMIQLAPDAGAIDRHAADVIHVFNAWPPKSALNALVLARATGARVVFSPVLLDLRAFRVWAEELPALFSGGAPAEAQLAALGREAQRLHRSPLGAQSGLYPRHAQDQRLMMSLADEIVALSEFEKRRIEELAPGSSVRVVHNAVDGTEFDGVDPAAFRERYGVSDYVLCVGRLEPRKNQLLLARALRNERVKLVLVGQAAHPEYEALIRTQGPPGMVLTGPLERDSAMFRSAVAGAGVFALPSWAEGAPLSALEAGAAGKPLVLGMLSGEQEIFGEFATYVAPYDLAAIRSGVLAALERPAVAGQARFLASTYTWQRHIEQTVAGYRRALEHPCTNPLPAAFIETDRALEELRLRAAHLEAELAGVRASRSWRLTAPLRWLSTRWRGMLGR